jgi:peptide/nickel transport system substrate-binding protein
VARAEAIDDDTVVVTWKAPNPNPYQLFTSFSGVILQKRQFENFSGANASQAPGNRNPIGTGPYKVKEFRPGDMVLYELNERYREPDKPFSKKCYSRAVAPQQPPREPFSRQARSTTPAIFRVEASVLQEIIHGGRGAFVVAVGPQVERLLLNRADPSTVDSARSEPGTQHRFVSDLSVRQAHASGVAIKRADAGRSGVALTELLGIPSEHVFLNA